MGRGGRRRKRKGKSDDEARTVVRAAEEGAPDAVHCSTAL